jgi:hypothetical protein
MATIKLVAKSSVQRSNQPLKQSGANLCKTCGKPQALALPPTKLRCKQTTVCEIGLKHASQLTIGVVDGNWLC